MGSQAIIKVETVYGEQEVFKMLPAAAAPRAKP